MNQIENSIPTAYEVSAHEVYGERIVDGRLTGQCEWLPAGTYFLDGAYYPAREVDGGDPTVPGSRRFVRDHPARGGHGVKMLQDGDPRLTRAMREVPA